MKAAHILPTGIYQRTSTGEARKVLNFFAFNDCLRYVVVANPARIGVQEVISVKTFARWAKMDVS